MATAHQLAPNFAFAYEVGLAVSSDARFLASAIHVLPCLKGC